MLQLYKDFMCSKNEVDCTFNKLVTLFYHRIQCDETLHFVHTQESGNKA